MVELTLKTNGIPRIESVKPAAALPGGEVSLKGTGFGTRNHTRVLRSNSGRRKEM